MTLAEPSYTADTTRLPWILPLRECFDPALIGGKAVNLGQLLRAGFPVPDGFVLTTAAFHHARSTGADVPEDLAAEIQRHYQRLGRPTVAVRSSATAEDLKGASMAGQYETFLGVRDEEELLDAVRRCWHSIDAPRITAYLHQQGIDKAHVAMAVVVQRLVPADIAGVAFTINPRTGHSDQMLIEASWGLGESVVSGEVQPDTLTIARDDGRVLDASIADKSTYLDPVTRQHALLAEDQRRRPCLNSRHVHALWELAHKVEQHFRHPQDLEWAISQDELFLLQSRAVTTLEPLQERLRAIHAARAEVGALLEQGRGPWVLHNISETLPHPTPFTWSVIRQFLSGNGGFGGMYRTAGFEPSPEVADEGFVGLLAGRVYMDLSRAPEMFFADFPFAYDPAVLRNNPDAGQSPPTLPRGTVGQQLRVGRKLSAVVTRINRLAQDYDQTLERQTIPAFIEWVRTQKAVDLKSLDGEQFIQAWNGRRAGVLDEFAPASLLPSLILGQLQTDLQSMMAEHLWDEDSVALARDLSAGASADKTVQANAALFEVANGARTIDTWLAEFGHRGPNELDLSAPRWHERPDDLVRLASQLRGGLDPAVRHHEQQAAAQTTTDRVRAALPARERARFDQLLARIRRYMPYREDGKFYLMIGYELLRDWALEAGRRLGIGDSVFFLSLDEVMTSLDSGYAPLSVIALRTRQHAAMAKLDVPQLIDVASVPQIGEPPVPRASIAWKGFSISTGHGQGPACVVEDPASAPAVDPGYILVCRTTDPSWTPLFVNAAGVVLERGGSLSHGAIVAREIGVPAVVVPGATRLLAPGHMIHVDGDRGLVSLADATTPTGAEPQVDPDDIDLEPKLIPPPPGPKDRSAARWRNLGAAVWVLYIALAFLLPPAWLYEPSMTVLDKLLWPLMAAVGPVWGTAVIAAGIAVGTMALQRGLTDNARLLEAKHRAADLQRQVAMLPKGSRRAAVMLHLAGKVQPRLIGTAMVPIGLLLGPMVMLFMWLPVRIDPAVKPPPAGVRFVIKATVDGESQAPVTLQPGPLRWLEESPQKQLLPPFRSTLRSLRAKLATAPDTENQPWQLQAADDVIRTLLLNDLDAYLSGPLPDQTIAWSVLSPQAEGVHTFHLQAGTNQPLALTVATGERTLPQATTIEGAGPIRSVTLVYPPKLPKDLVFFRPFEATGWNADLGWLGVYVLVYLPAMILARRALRLP